MWWRDICGMWHGHKRLGELVDKLMQICSSFNCLEGLAQTARPETFTALKTIRDFWSFGWMGMVDRHLEVECSEVDKKYER